MGCAGGRRPQIGPVLRAAILTPGFIVFLAALVAGEPAVPEVPAAAAPHRYTRVAVAPSKTSIYIGNVSLTVPPLVRQGAAFTADYRAKVFPFFFYGEHGHFSIDFPEDHVQRLFRGEVVQFQGHALNSAGEGRRIEGRAVPEGAGADHGRIKIRVWVGKIELIFNSTYQFTGAD
jgi:hypothetical protein